MEAHAISGDALSRFVMSKRPDVDVSFSVDALYMLVRRWRLLSPTTRDLMHRFPRISTPSAATQFDRR